MQRRFENTAFHRGIVLQNRRRLLGVVNVDDGHPSAAVGERTAELKAPLLQQAGLPAVGL